MNQKPDNRVSLSTTVFGSEREGMTLESMLEAVAQAGYEMVELSRNQKGFGRLEALLPKLGLLVWSIHGTLSERAASLDEDERRAAVEAELPRLRDSARFAPCPYVVHYMDRYNDRRHAGSFRRSIEELFAEAKPLGLIVAVETAPYKPLQNERYPDSREIAAFVRSFSDPQLQMTIDINHSNLYEKLPDVCGNCRGLIANVHVSDNHGEWEDHLPPGEGIIPLADTFRALRANGYQGPCNLEFHGDDRLTTEFLRQVRETVEKTLF